MVGERALAGLVADNSGDSSADNSVEYIIASMLPSGPRTRNLDRALADNVAAAVLYLQHKRGIHQVCLQCYQRCDEGEPQFLPSITPMPAPCACVPAGDCGWSFFLIEKTLEEGRAAVQAYLFYE